MCSADTLQWQLLHTRLSGYGHEVPGSWRRQRIKVGTDVIRNENKFATVHSLSWRGGFPNPLFVKHILGFHSLQLDNKVLFVSLYVTKDGDVGMLRLPSALLFAFLLFSPHWVINFGKLLLLQTVKQFPVYCGAQLTVTCSQKPVRGSYPRQTDSSPTSSSLIPRISVYKYFRNKLINEDLF